MIINRNSWHYKVAIFGENEYSTPKSLCPYFWCIVFKLFMASCVIAALLMASWLLGSAILTAILTALGITFAGVVAVVSSTATGAVAIAGIFGGAFLGFMGISSLKHIIKEKLDTRRRIKRFEAAEAGIELQPNVFVEFIKTRKSKMCPMLEFKTIEK